VFIHQHWLQRFGSVLPAGLVMSAFIFTIPLPFSSIDLVVLLIFVGVPLWLVIRSFRAGVRLSDDRMLIRGWFWSRSIPRDRIVGLTPRKFVEWTSETGSTRLSPLTVFWTWPNSWGLFDSYNGGAFEKINHWIGREEEHTGRHIEEPDGTV